MSVIAGLGLTLGKALIPTLLGRLVKGKGVVAEKIAEAALEITGLGPDASEEEVMAQLQKDPNAMLRLKELAATEAVAEIEAQVKLAEFETQDRISAREMNLATRDPIINKLVWMSVAFLITAFITVVGLTAITAFYDIQIDQVWIAIVSTMVGNASARFDQVFHFFLGSSQGSKDKDHSISSMASSE